MSPFARLNAGAGLAPGVRWGMARIDWVLGLAIVGLSGCGGDDGDGDEGAEGSAAPAGDGVGGAGGASSPAPSGASGSAEDERCARGCQATLAADCPNGPPTQESCETDCQSLGSGPCAAEYELLMDCADGQTLECSPMGIPVVTACSNEQTTFIACLNGG